ncbi:type II toxin-antitoxin system YafQ family toxin [Bombiscardovia coagulans]|uniref:Addiction module toxin RelE n=1 Tax=Bombiscardovia coagulans TaxID=686666 RepID=A0A261EU69_9BIFI|nr:type II toxin-antitoxin system YafQ family toxin [Bombiscardovia coagulans]OZG50399.1 addiction module toxin RelE [Bombiscardovia coagulans]
MYELKVSKDFRKDYRRLSRWNPKLARELTDLLEHELQVYGRVPEQCRPHTLDNRGGLYNGCGEFHLLDDVLVIYSPFNPKGTITLRRICTHRELRTGRFGHDWPSE